MRFMGHVIMFGMALDMALGMSLPLPCGDHPEIWQDDGYGGKIWTVNPDCYQKEVTNTSPTQAKGLPSTKDSNDTITEYEAYEEEYVDAEEDDQEVPPHFIRVQGDRMKHTLRKYKWN